jgi:hypothetical protein
VINTYTTTIIREVQPIALDGVVLGATILLGMSDRCSPLVQAVAPF